MYIVHHHLVKRARVSPREFVDLATPSAIYPIAPWSRSLWRILRSPSRRLLPDGRRPSIDQPRMPGAVPERK